MTSPLRLGVIGISPGNGHPYSWSAIFNGYNPIAMEKCGFPVIPRYLEKQKFPQDAIEGARVTHVWTQDLERSQHIAKAARIDYICADLNDFIGQVDGILLARDDAEYHLAMAQPFLDAGLPIYIDKPLALSTAGARTLIELQRYPGQLFSCSALRYAADLRLNDVQRAAVGEIRSVHATVPKNWDQYAVHAIEPALDLVPDRGERLRYTTWRCKDRVTLHVEYAGGVDLLITSSGATASPIALHVFGTLGWFDLLFTNTFAAFRAALQDFVDGIKERDVRTSPDRILEIVGLIEAGRQK